MATTKGKADRFLKELKEFETKRLAELDINPKDVEIRVTVLIETLVSYTRDPA